MSHDGKGIRVGLLVACGLLSAYMEVEGGGKIYPTRSKLAARIKGTQVICIATLVGLWWYAPYC